MQPLPLDAPSPVVHEATLGTGGATWAHLNRLHPDSAAWLVRDPRVPDLAVDAVMEQETRPRVARLGSGLVVILRAVNLNPGAEPDDMLGVRIWLTQSAVVTITGYRVMGIEDLAAEYARGTGPDSVGGFLARLVDAMTDRLEPVVEALDEQMDDAEERIIEGEIEATQAEVAEIRRQAIRMHRFLLPQREALAKLAVEPTAPLGEVDRAGLRETADRVARIVELLAEVRERAVVAQEEIGTRVATRLGRTIYILTVLSAIILPLTLVAGLLGMNVGGIPGATSTWGFWQAVGVLVVFAAIEYLLFRKLRWL